MEAARVKSDAEAKAVLDRASAAKASAEAAEEAAHHETASAVEASNP